MAKTKQIVNRACLVLGICLLTCVVLWFNITSLSSGTSGEASREFYMDTYSIYHTMKCDVCKNFKPEKRFLAVLLVTSYVSNWELRMTHRAAIPQAVLGKMGIQRVFLLGQIPSIDLSINQTHLQMEQDKYGDLLQGNYVDTYRNLSYKYVMGFEYALENCENLLYIVKADDDIVQDIDQVYNYLNWIETVYPDLGHSGHLLAGVVSYDPPVRDKLSPWYVSLDEYPEKKYPEHLSGWLFISNVPTIQHIFNAIETIPFFWVPDVWITGIIRKHLNLALINLHT